MWRTCRTCRTSAWAGPGSAERPRGGLPDARAPASTERPRGGLPGARAPASTEPVRRRARSPRSRRAAAPPARNRARQADRLGLTRPSATTSLASRIRRFRPPEMRNFWYSRSRCCLTAASVTTRLAAISRAVAGATNASSDSAGRHSATSTSSSRRVSSGTVGRRSSASVDRSSRGRPPIRHRAVPNATTSPSSSSRRPTGRPFTRVPLRDNPRSATYAYGPRRMISACSSDTLGSLRRTSTARPRPTVVTSPASGTTSPVSSTRMKGVSTTGLLPIGAVSNPSPMSYPGARPAYRRPGTVRVRPATDRGTGDRSLIAPVNCQRPSHGETRSSGAECGGHAG